MKLTSGNANQPQATVTVAHRLYFTALVMTGAAIITALVIGIPTDVVPNPWFTRMTPVRPLDYIFLTTMSLMSAVTISTYILPRFSHSKAGASAAGSGLLTLLAIGCPVCNKLVVALLGFSGAFTYFEPIQPILGVVGVALAALGAYVRLRGTHASCNLETPTSP